MARILHIVISFIWSLWLGGLIMLFLAVQSLFHTFTDRHLAGTGAAGIFHDFNYYHLSLAALALLTTFLWWLDRRLASRILAFFLFALATIVAVYVSAVLTPQLEKLRAEALTESARFRQLHGMSMGLFLLETVFVLMAGIAVNWTTRPAADRKPDRGVIQL